MAQLQTADIIKLVLTLKEENQKLLTGASDVVVQKYEERFVRLERELNLQKQYERRSSIEISGIPTSVPDEEIEEACITVIKAAKAKAHNKFPGHFDIQAAHRKGKKGIVICKFVNRKFAYSAVSNGKNLKGVEIFEGGEPVYINSSLCPEFGYLHFAVRQAKKNNKLHSYRVRQGVMYVKKTEADREVQVSHETDLVNIGLPLPPRKY